MAFDLKLLDQNRTGVFREREEAEFCGARMSACRLTIRAREALIAAGADIQPADAPMVPAMAGGWEPAIGQYWDVALGQRCPPRVLVRETFGVAGYTMRLDDEPAWPNEIANVPIWGQLDLTPCPHCGAALAWYEAGYVPGYRVCAGPQHHHWLARAGTPECRHEQDQT